MRAVFLLTEEHFRDWYHAVRGVMCHPRFMRRVIDCDLRYLFEPAVIQAKRCIKELGVEPEILMQ